MKAVSRQENHSVVVLEIMGQIQATFGNYDPNLRCELIFFKKSNILVSATKRISHNYEGRPS